MISIFAPVCYKKHQIRGSDEKGSLFGMAVKILNGAQASQTKIDRFWSGVFDRWTSTKIPTAPRYKNRQAADSSIQVGVFKCDLPLGKVK